MMTTKMMAAIAAVTTLLTSTVAMAQLQEFDRSRGWVASAGAAVDGSPMCLMSTTGSDRMVTIKWFAKWPDVYLHIFRNGWHVPYNAPMQFILNIDTNPAFEGIARGLKGGGDGIQASFPGKSDVLRRFLREIISGKMMYFRFPSGNDPGWYIGLEGAGQVGRSFMRCITTYEARYGTAQPQVPQPHEGGQSAQPDQTQPHQGGAPSVPMPTPTKRAPIPGEQQL